jgi:hypothetical protein
MGLLGIDAENIVLAIEEWPPGPCLSEARCQGSLANWLQRRFVHSTFHLEHPVGEGRADIFAELRTRWCKGADVIIELKYNLTDRSEYLRLKGQLDEYVGNSSAEIVVVLCGSTKPEWVTKIRAYLDKLVAERFFYKARVVTKSIIVRGRDGRFLPASVSAVGG